MPGVAPVEFKNGSKIEVKAVKLTSMMTQLPYEYYSLPFCLPKNGTVVRKSENLGQSIVVTVAISQDMQHLYLLTTFRGSFERGPHHQYTL